MYRAARRGRRTNVTPTSDTGWLVFGDVATAVAPAAALTTVALTIVYGRKTATELGKEVIELRNIASGLNNQLSELGAIGSSLQSVGKGISETAALTRLARDDDLYARDHERRERLIDRYMEIGSLVEQIFWAAQDEYNVGYTHTDWMHYRNRLSVLIVGLTHQLPKCADVRNAGSRQDALGKASTARGEVELAITTLLEDAQIEADRRDRGYDE
jgi:hypothetical protein